MNGATLNTASESARGAILRDGSLRSSSTQRNHDPYVCSAIESAEEAQTSFVLHFRLLRAFADRLTCGMKYYVRRGLSDHFVLPHVEHDSINVHDGIYRVQRSLEESSAVKLTIAIKLSIPLNTTNTVASPMFIGQNDIAVNTICICLL